jgi:hypothetical protein
MRRTRRAAVRLGRLPEALQLWVRVVESWLCHDSVLLYLYLLADPASCPWPEPWPVGTENQRTTSTSTHRRLNSNSVNRALVAHLRPGYRAPRLHGACLHQVRRSSPRPHGALGRPKLLARGIHARPQRRRDRHVPHPCRRPDHARRAAEPDDHLPDRTGRRVGARRGARVLAPRRSLPLPPDRGLDGAGRRQPHDRRRPSGRGAPVQHRRLVPELHSGAGPSPRCLSQTRHRIPNSGPPSDVDEGRCTAGRTDTDTVATAAATNDPASSGLPRSEVG